MAECTTTSQHAVVLEVHKLRCRWACQGQRSGFQIIPAYQGQAKESVIDVAQTCACLRADARTKGSEQILQLNASGASRGPQEWPDRLLVIPPTGS